MQSKRSLQTLKNLKNLRPKLNGHILFVFSDPGGAKPCLSLLEESQCDNALLLSDRHYEFYKDFNAIVKCPEEPALEIVKKIKPDLIFTGTSYTSGIEREFISAASTLKVPCYSFIDHWTSMAKRFLNNEGQILFPDQVWVIDEKAKQIAIAEGIPSEIVMVTGNPYHTWLYKWRPNISNEDFRKNAGIVDDKKQLMIYAPDPLSNVDGRNAFGFDEYSSTKILIELLERNAIGDKNLLIMVKLHPNQQKDKIEKILSESSLFHILPDSVDTNTAIFYSSLVIGFFSSFLIESQIMNRKVIRFIVDEALADPFEGMKIGVKTNQNFFIKELSKHLK